MILIEHRWLYWQEDGVPEESFTTPMGIASILLEGKDVTVVATSWMTVEAVKAAETIPEGQAVSLKTEFFPRLIGHGLYAVVGEGPFLDIGTPEAYTMAEQFLASEALA